MPRQSFGIAAALLIAIDGRAPRTPRRRRVGVHHRLRRRPRERRAGLCRVLRRRRHPRVRPSKPQRRSIPTRAAKAAAVAARHGKARRQRRALVVPAEQGRPDARRRPHRRTPPSEYRAITSFALKVRQARHRSTTSVSAIAGANLFEVRTIRYGIKDEERVIDDARRAAVKNAAGRPRSMPTRPASSSARFWKSSTASRRTSGSRPRCARRHRNVQLSPPATIPFRAAITMKMADRPAAVTLQALARYRLASLTPFANRSLPAP